ncbi:hypothetical protein QN224_31750 [Sinorhizobium sp. 8-89]|uniref:hypothetical protein n=1 Tax=Sinorhizobium sp. 7-81 TaxID=3049087 RepID=UPI0024C32039|nr:hypothetical protein [Sinorhizobium sp. 7-81]MDK1389908.1 hypothetical protein [Sinorhizobium sp. 7-81]
MQITIDHRSGGRRALLLAFMAAVIEGFDLQAAGVAVPKLAPAFGLTPQQIGLFFSSATVGLIFGRSPADGLPMLGVGAPDSCFRW